MPTPSPIQIIPNLVQGVSQQAVQNRRDPQCEAQFDCVNSVLEGVVARPHANLVKMWPGRVLTGSRFSETFHGADENYLTGIGPTGTPFAIDLSDGTDCTITQTAPDYSYLIFGADSSRDKLRTQVVDDFTFISNRDKLPAMDPAILSPSNQPSAIVFVRATAFSSTYTVTVQATSGALTTATHTTSASTVEPTDSIANSLLALLNNVGFSAFRSGSTILITRADLLDFTLTTTDGNGDTFMLGFKGTAQKFSSLPARAFDGNQLKVAGDPTTSADDFYVIFKGPSTTGAWQETVAPGIKTTLDASTMPHALVCTGLRAFQFRRLAWSTRIAGDETTSKDPSFVGKSIRDMVYHQRRLALIWSGGVSFSKADNPFTHFADTVQTVLATAPVDIKVSSGDKRGAAVLDFALQAQENLYLWAQKVQFRVSSGNDPFKQDTAEVLPSMSYQYAPNAYPLTLGSFVFVASDSGAYASLRSLLYTQTKLSGDVDVTSHVGQYMKAGVREMTASETLRSLFIQSDGDTSVVYLFNYTYDGDQGFIQTGLNTWRIPGGAVLWIGLKDSTLRMIQQRPEGVAFLTFDLTPQSRDPIAGAGYLTRLDMRRDETGVTGLAYNATTATSSFTLPYLPTGPDVLVVTSEDLAGGHTRGRVFETVSVVGAVVTVKGDLTGGYRFYVGQRISAVRDESEFQVRGDKGALPVDRLDLARFYLTLASTAYTRIEVSAEGKTTKEYPFTGRVLGGATARTGPPTPVNGMLQAAIGENASKARIRIINDSFLPSYWQSAAYSYTAVGWGGIT